MKYSGKLCESQEGWVRFARSLMNQALTDDDIRREWNKVQDPVKLVRAVLGQPPEGSTNVG